MFVHMSVAMSSCILMCGTRANPGPPSEEDYCSRVILQYNIVWWYGQQWMERWCTALQTSGLSPCGGCDNTFRCCILLYYTMYVHMLCLIAFPQNLATMD